MTFLIGDWRYLEKGMHSHNHNFLQIETFILVIELCEGTGIKKITSQLTKEMELIGRHLR